jgi:UDP-GlcNAc:undecaprenyl-phosphate GlcNAc-1-phosphate transferase
MPSLILILIISLAAALVLTPLARRCAARIGLVDRPDGRRKIHTQATPVAGGLALWLSLTATVTVVLFLPGALGDACRAQLQTLVGLLLASLLICVLGVADDFGCLRGRHKLAGQVVAVGIVISFGVVVRHLRLFSYELDLGLLAIPFTAFLLLGAVNSLNLIDGMDGLLAIVGLIISLTLAVMASAQHNWPAVCVALALGGALLGFVRYNFPPASIFLGDSGSMLIGLVIGVLAISSSLKAPATVALAAPTALLTIPIFDTTAAILRRKLTGRSIYTTDCGHLHHCLLRRGLSSQRALMVIACFSLFIVAGVLGSLALRNELMALLSALAVVAMLVATRLFGHAELNLLRQRLRSMGASFLRRPNTASVNGTEFRLQGTLDWSELWSHMIDCGRKLNLQSIRLNVHVPALHEGYHARWDAPHLDTEDLAEWRAEIPLTVHGRIIGRLEVAGSHDDDPAWQKMAALAALVPDFEHTAALLTERGAESEPSPQSAIHGPKSPLRISGIGVRV